MNNNSILNIDKMNSFIMSATPRTISKIWQLSSQTIYWWMGVPSDKTIDAIELRIPEINEFIDLNAVKSKVSNKQQRKTNLHLGCMSTLKTFFLS